jgi:hypothetical protein
MKRSRRFGGGWVGGARGVGDTPVGARPSEHHSGAGGGWSERSATISVLGPQGRLVPISLRSDKTDSV